MYYTIEITSTDAQTAKGIFDFPSQKAATMAYHQAIAAAMANPKIVHGVFIVMNGNGATIAMEVYNPSEDEPEAK